MKYTAKDFSNITIDEMKKQFPYSDKKIIKIAKDSIFGRVAEVDIYDSSNTHIFSTFAQLHRVLSITLNDCGQDSVTPSGTYHSQRGIVLNFNLSGFWDDKGKRKFSINASKNIPSGMCVYNSIDITDLQDIKMYISAILESNKVNNLRNMVY